MRTLDAGQELWLRADDGRERRLAVHHGEEIADIRWTLDGSMLLYRVAQRGREHWRLARMRMADLDHVRIPLPGSVTEYWLSRSDPGAAACSVRSGRSRYPELFRLELADPARAHSSISPNPGFRRWLVDGQLQPRGGIRPVEDGGAQVVLGDDLSTTRIVLTAAVDDIADLAVQGFSRDGRQLFLLTSGGAETRRLLAVDSRSGATSTVFAHPRLDIMSYPIAGDGVWFDPRTGRPDICTVMDQRLRHHALTPARQPAIRALAATADASPVIIDRSADDRVWLVVDVRDNGPIAYKLLDPATGESNLLFFNRPELSGCDLPKLEDFCFTASDGRTVSGYAMRPLGADVPLPTVAIVHGGPVSRDIWRFHAEAQYLASLGYLSLHINYRGSSGFGREFRLAGDGQWGAAMQQDLYDAIEAGIAAGLVDANRVAFMGASYGGYASLLAACTRPDLVRCAVVMSTPCDLVSFVRRPTPYWQPLAVLVRRQICTPRSGEQLDDLELGRRSPMQVVDESCAPLLIAHGGRDPRVPIAETDAFTSKCRSLGVPIRYLRFEDEGHYVKSNANRAILFKELEDFLEEHLAKEEAR